MGIHERLKEERLRLGYNQSEFAAAGGVTKNSQFNYEKGDRSPDAGYLAAIADIGVDVYYVVTGRRVPLQADALNEEETQMVGYMRRLRDPADRESILRHAYVLAASAAAYANQAP
ncbi:helix-turn-helix domain-containing protein [Pseudomonas mangiferae]|uniref:Helix-turn-helix transcriptional regulator n=1 Tax=Pseudomonas mangiferae TaxID=2593654 RepID=A0A553H0P6_9PSED|nr:helix-turn-helix transcriptional regulator [Pseudomonas mangiferae]